VELDTPVAEWSAPACGTCVSSVPVKCCLSYCCSSKNGVSSVKAILRCVVLQVVGIRLLVGDLLFCGEFTVIHGPLFYLTTTASLFTPRLQSGRMSALLIRQSTDRVVNKFSDRVMTYMLTTYEFCQIRDSDGSYVIAASYIEWGGDSVRMYLKGGVFLNVKWLRIHMH
jgi:hypothetical protein